MLTPQIEQALVLVEQRFNALSDAILTGELHALGVASDDFRQATVDFSHFLQSLDTSLLQQPQLKWRLKRIAQGMQQQRVGLIRRTVGVERGLKVLLADEQSQSTYAKSAGPYGSSVKSSGAFKLLVA